MPTGTKWASLSLQSCHVPTFLSKVQTVTDSSRLLQRCDNVPGSLHFYVVTTSLVVYKVTLWQPNVTLWVRCDNVKLLAGYRVFDLIILKLYDDGLGFRVSWLLWSSAPIDILWQVRNSQDRYNYKLHPYRLCGSWDSPQTFTPPLSYLRNCLIAFKSVIWQWTNNVHSYPPRLIGIMLLL